jgi:hypothetical protein
MRMMKSPGEGERREQGSIQQEHQPLPPCISSSRLTVPPLRPGNWPGGPPPACRFAEEEVVEGGSLVYNEGVAMICERMGQFMSARRLGCESRDVVAGLFREQANAPTDLVNDLSENAVITAHVVSTLLRRAFHEHPGRVARGGERLAFCGRDGAREFLRMAKRA